MVKSCKSTNNCKLINYHYIFCIIKKKLIINFVTKILNRNFHNRQRKRNTQRKNLKAKKTSGNSFMIRESIKSNRKGFIHIYKYIYLIFIYI